MFLNIFRIHSIGRTSRGGLLGEKSEWLACRYRRGTFWQAEEGRFTSKPNSLHLRRGTFWPTPFRGTSPTRLFCLHLFGLLNKSGEVHQLRDSRNTRHRYRKCHLQEQLHEKDLVPSHLKHLKASRSLVARRSLRAARRSLRAARQVSQDSVAGGPRGLLSWVFRCVEPLHPGDTSKPGRTSVLLRILCISAHL